MHEMVGPDRDRLLRFETPPAWYPVGRLEPFEFSHRLEASGLFGLEALIGLADRLPSNGVETMDAEQEPVDSERTPRRVEPGTGGGLLSSIAEDGRWMSLLGIQRDAAYRDELDRIVNAFRSAVDHPDALHGVEGYVFASAPGSTTPAHIDHEHNLYFQLAGTKRFTIGTFPDQAAENAAFEAMYSGDYGATDFFPVDPITYELAPGDGLFVPPEAVHLVQNLGEPSLSLSVVFHTDELIRAGKVYAANAKLRRLGVEPTPPGVRPGTDRAKSALVDLWRTLRTAQDRLGT